MSPKAPPKELLEILSARFEANLDRHPDVDWAEVETLLSRNSKYWKSVEAMENSGGEPDVVMLGSEKPRLAIVDCAAESPVGRRSLCFDEAALNSRKANKPRGSSQGMAADMGIQMLNEEEYRALQQLGRFDMKTSTWIATPPSIRDLGGALFCDRRYGQVFTYHNGAESYYASRGFRGVLYLSDL